MCLSPRFKVHLQVIDNGGSTTFILFDRVVSQVLGNTVQDLLDAMGNRNDTAAYPPELNVFVDKRKVFKVEVSDANLFRNWRSYTVKKLTMDGDIIKRFLIFHGISEVNDEEAALCVGRTIDVADSTPLEALEGGDSNNKDEGPDAIDTPTSKQIGKRPAVSAEGLDSSAIERGEFSATKEPRMICLKTLEST